MISLSVTIYQHGDADQFKVHLKEGDAELQDVTDQYEIAACATPDGRNGWAVFEKEPKAEPVQVTLNGAPVCGGTAHPMDGRCEKCGAQVDSTGVCSAVAQSRYSR